MATVRPRDIAGRTRRQLAWRADQRARRHRPRRSRPRTSQLTGLAAATGSSLQDLHGIGLSSAARLLGDAVDIARFADRGHFASWNGTAPIDASSGDQQRHRLFRAGNRRISRGAAHHGHRAAAQRHRRRADHRRKLAAGKTPMEAIRRLKRRLPGQVYRQMINDARASATGPAGHTGTATGSQHGRAAPQRLHFRRSHFPDPPPATLRRHAGPLSRLLPAPPPPCGTAAVVKRPLLDDGEDRRTLARRGTIHPLDIQGSHVSVRLFLRAAAGDDPMPLLAVGARDLWAGLAPAWPTAGQRESGSFAVFERGGYFRCHWASLDGDRLPAPHTVNCDGAVTATLPVASGPGQTATSSRRLASAAEPARPPAGTPGATGSSCTAHSSRQLFEARSRAELMVQLAIRLLTAPRW